MYWSEMFIEALQFSTSTLKAQKVGVSRLIVYKGKIYFSLKSSEQ